MEDSKDELNKELLEAVKNGNSGKVERLLKDGADKNARYDSNGHWTVLMYAARRGFLDISRLLIEAGAGVNAKDDYDITALMRAAEGGDLKIVKFLVKKGADIHAKDKDDRTALWWAAWCGKVDVAKFLLDEKADLEAKNIDGDTPLIAVASSNRKNDKNNQNVVMLLLEKGANVNAQNKIGYTALMMAAELGNLDIVEILVEAPGVDVNAKNKAGNTALTLARRKGYKAIEDLLLANGATE